MASICIYLIFFPGINSTGGREGGKMCIRDSFTTERRVSYSYTDVLTKSVELVIYAPEGEDEVNEQSVSEVEDIV